MKLLEKTILFTKSKMSFSLSKSNILKKYMQKVALKNIIIFQNLRQINIVLWNDIIESGNILLLDKNYSTDTKYNRYQIESLDEQFKNLYDAYFLALNNRKAKAQLEKSQEKVVMSLKVIVLKDALNTLCFIRDNQRFLKDYLSKENKVYQTVKTVVKNVNFKQFNTLQENIDVLEKVFKSVSMEFERKFESEKEIKKNYTFEKQVADVEQVLGRSLDIAKCNVIQWIEYINKVDQLIKINESNNGKYRK